MSFLMASLLKRISHPIRLPGQLNRDVLQACVGIVVIGDKQLRCQGWWRRWLSKWSADDQPGPGNLLFHIDASHILFIGAAGARKACGVAMVNADNAVGMMQFHFEKVLGCKLEVDRRVENVAQWIGLFSIPVALLISLPQQHAAGLNAGSFAD